MLSHPGDPNFVSVLNPLAGVWYVCVAIMNLGLFFLRYTVKLGENTLSQPGCHHICKKEIEEKKCCPGFWGTECYECPGGFQNPCNGHGSCLDGMQQNGTCICKEQYGGFACQNCRGENRFGPDCQSVCDCVHGECNSGVAGNGSCTCYGGYTGPRCDQELPLCKGVTCEANSECVVRDGTAMCDCKLGYRKSGNTCQALDPCAASPCSPFAVCKVLGPRKYQCTCKDGFQGDGKICQPINPCVDSNGGCPENSTICVYRRPGEASCVCKPGMSRRTPSSECSVFPNDCRQYFCDLTSKCEINSQGNPSCVCKEGEIGDGRSCYKDLLSEINQHNSRGRFARKLNVAKKMFGKCLLNFFGEWTCHLSSLCGLYSPKDTTAEHLCRMHIVPGLHLVEDMIKAKTVWTLSGHRLTFSGQLCFCGIYTSVIFHTYPWCPVASCICLLFNSSASSGLLSNCGLPAILDGPGPFTVFVPSNDGVDKLRDGRLIYLFTEVRVTVEKLIMMPHIVTMANQILTINISADGRILMDESGIPLNMRDIVASNGIIHTLDGIFIPPSIIPILPHRCNEEQHKIVTGSCVDCEALNNSEPTLFPKECVYIHDPQGLNVLKKGCARYCNQTVTKPGCCKGFFGPDCMPCPGGYSNPCYGRGNCSDGIQGSGNCQCFEGFKGIACHICSNPNKHGENCDEDCGCVHGICDNRPGSGGVCQSWSCKEGYTGKFCDKMSKNCGPSGLSQYCHQNAVCSLNDTARCICTDGYEGDGFSCQPIDLCSQPERGGCSQNALCTSTGPGTATCKCNTGWTGDGKACVAIDNCMLESRGSCHINADCIYIGPGQSNCVCKRGYAGDGHNCDAINPCLMDNGGCHDLAMCVPLGGGERSCACPQGYMGDGMTCYGDILKELARNSHFAGFYDWLKKSLFSIPAGTNVTVLVPSEAAIKNLNKTEKDFWLTPYMLPFLVRAHFLEGVFTSEKLKKYDKPELPTLNPQTRWQINTRSGVRVSYIMHMYKCQIKLLKSCCIQWGDNETVQYHIVLGEKLLPTDLRSGIHKNSMLGLSYWLMFYQNSTQNFVNNIPLDGKFLETKNGMLIGVSQVLQIQKNRCTANTTTIQKVMRSVCCPGYYGHMCDMCPGKPGQWCSGNGECQDGIEGSGECRCLEGFHGTACEMCEVGRYGADCKSECACDNGICNDGLQGDGSCQCFPGWKGPTCQESTCSELILLLLFGVTEIDPCTIDHGGCSIHAVCTKVSPGERTCVCKEGYAGDGTLCMGECSVHVLVIHLFSLQVACNCLPGYSGNGVSQCNPINLCEQNNGGCSPFGLCKYTGPGTRNCSCSWHSIGDGFTCHGKVYQVRSMRSIFLLCSGPCPAANGSLPSKRLLRDLLRYHMVGCQKLLSSDLEAQESLTSLSGHKIKITAKENSIYLNEEAKVVVSDIIGVNGVIHFINKILIPSDLVDRNQNITDLTPALLPLVNDPRHRPFTMLWPTDAAFNALSEKRQKWLYRREHRDVLASYLKAHMIRDTKIVAGNVPQVESIRTMHGSAVSFSCSKTHVGELLVGNGDATIIQRHMEFNGGIAYGIDRLLEPPDLGSRCDEFSFVELQVSTCDESRGPVGQELGWATWGQGLHWSLLSQSQHWGGPLKRGCKRSCVSTQWVPQCCANHYGRDCQACPGGPEAPCGNRGTCEDKISGSGRCNCSQAYIGTSCELCAPGRYGADCRECNCTENGVCNGGLHGDGFCFCAEGWAGDRCEIRLVMTPTCSPPCHPQAVCRSNNLCECNLHYEGDGRTCSVIDMCSQDNGGCARHAQCTQVGVNVSCACASGYGGDGYVCDPIDRCADGRNGDCSQHANCISTGPNERRCECKQGYVGDGIQCLEEAVPPTDRCLEDNGQCHREAICTDLHFHDKTMGVFHLQSPRKKYDFTYEQAQKACAAEGASLATLQQLSAAQQMGFHLCLVGWLDNGTAGYPTAYPNPSCGANRVGIVDYGSRTNLSETWDAFCYREKDLTCTCRDGFVGDGYWCSGKLPDVLADDARFSTFYSMLLDFANDTEEGLDFFIYLSDDSAPKTLFVPLNSGFADNEDAKGINDTMIVEWDIIAFNGIIHAIAEPLRIPPPIVHLGQVSVRGHGRGRKAPKQLAPGLGAGTARPAPSSLLPRHGSFWLGCPRSAGWPCGRSRRSAVTGPPFLDAGERRGAGLRGHGDAVSAVLRAGAGCRRRRRLLLREEAAAGGAVRVFSGERRRQRPLRGRGRRRECGAPRVPEGPRRGGDGGLRPRGANPAPRPAPSRRTSARRRRRRGLTPPGPAPSGRSSPSPTRSTAATPPTTSRCR
uniref:Stabilin 1 n=1 Tax=Aquila chrysaetos chrysaetos TaxID=223781 RepID=A0A663EVS1_AQUCH